MVLFINGISKGSISFFSKRDIKFFGSSPLLSKFLKKESFEKPELKIFISCPFLSMYSSG